MKNPIKAHRERVGKVKDALSKNKVFTAIAIIIIAVLISGVISSKSKGDRTSSPPETSEVAAAEAPQESDTGWRFYWIDLWILLVCGGFCAIMIAKERRKGKDSI